MHKDLFAYVLLNDEMYWTAHENLQQVTQTTTFNATTDIAFAYSKESPVKSYNGFYALALGDDFLEVKISC